MYRCLHYSLCPAPHHWLVGAPQASVCRRAWIGSPTGSPCRTAAFHWIQLGLDQQGRKKRINTKNINDHLNCAIRIFTLSVHEKTNKKNTQIFLQVTKTHFRPMQCIHFYWFDDFKDHYIISRFLSFTDCYCIHVRKWKINWPFILFAFIWAELWYPFWCHIILHIGHHHYKLW